MRGRPDEHRDTDCARLFVRDVTVVYVRADALIAGIVVSMRETARAIAYCYNSSRPAFLVPHGAVRLQILAQPEYRASNSVRSAQSQSTEIQR